MEALILFVVIFSVSWMFYHFDFRQRPPELLLFEPVNIVLGGVIALFGILASQDNTLIQLALTTGAAWVGMTYGAELRGEILKRMGMRNIVKGVLEGIAVMVVVFITFRLFHCSSTCALFLAAAASVSHPLAAKIFRDEMNLISAIDWTGGIVAIWIFETLRNPFDGLISPTVGLLSGFVFLHFNQSLPFAIRKFAGFAYALILGMIAFIFGLSPLIIGISAGIVFENLLQLAEDRSIDKALDYANLGIYVMFLVVAGNIVGSVSIKSPFFPLVYFLTRGLTKLSASNGRFILVPQGGLALAIAYEAMSKGCDSAFGVVVLGLVLCQLVGFIASSVRSSTF